MSDLIERAEKLLMQCGIHDYGLAGACTCSPDHRPIVIELIREIQRLRDELGSARDWEAWENAQAEIKKLRAECVEYDEANTDLGIALAEARAELDRTKPVVDAAEEWYAAFEYDELDDNYSAEERVLFNTIKANPSCPSCGPGGCAGHTKAVAEQPTGGISEKTMSALANYARATGMIPSDSAAEGLSSTDTTQTAVDHG